MESKFACYDIDGTLATEMLFVPLVIDEHSSGLISEDSFKEIMSLLERYKAGELEYEKAVQMLLEAHASALAGKEASKLRANAKEFVRTHQELFRSFGGKVIGLLGEYNLHQVAVTAEPEYVAEAVVEYLNLDGSFATQYEVHEGIYTGTIRRSLADRSAKRDVLSSYHIAFAFGDSEGDIEMLESADHAFCVNASAGLSSVAEVHGWKTYTEDQAIVSAVESALI